MFRENNDHLQKEFVNKTEDLPEQEEKQLAGSLAQTFYAELFYRIDELYDACPFSDRYPVKASERRPDHQVVFRLMLFSEESWIIINKITFYLTNDNI